MSEYQGRENLETATKRINFTKWVCDELFPGLRGDVLELGSGLGTYSKFIIRDFPESHITLSDISSQYIKNLKENFETENVSIIKLDLNNKDDIQKIGFEKFDSIIAINVLEHIEKDELALDALYKMLKKNGTLLILVPANEFLYNVIDESIGHWRRYTKKEFKTKLKRAKFKIKKIYSFNILGILGWYVNGNICKKREVNKQASGIFDKLISIMRIIEKILRRKIGLSIICYCEKEDS